MRGKTLDQLIEEVRAECRLSTNNSRGLENREYVAQVVKRNYETLYDDYDWQEANLLREDCFVTLNAGQRYYDFPENADLSTVSRVTTKIGNVWTPVEYGISLSDYNMIDSEGGRRADPVLKWQVRDGSQFEVWPIPASNDNLIGFDGKRKFVPLNAGDDRCLIDGIVVVLFSAADILDGLGQKDAQSKRNLATARLVKMRARTGGNRRCIIGGGNPNSGNGPGWPRIRVSYAR